MAKKKNKLSTMDKIAFILVIIGGLNWGVFGFFGYNFIYALVGSGLKANVIYSIIGVASLYMVYHLTKK